MEKAEEKYWHYEQISEQERACPKCAEPLHTFFSSLVMTSNPPQERWYWECNACGYQELGGVHVHKPVQINVAI